MAKKKGPLRPHLVYADEQGRIYDHPHLLMAGDTGSGPEFVPPNELVEIPRGSDIYTLPGRSPVGIDPDTGETVVLDGPFQAVSVFVAPAWLRLCHPVFEKRDGAPTLPLYAYAPMGFARGRFYTSAVRVDAEDRQDPWLFDVDDIEARVKVRRAASPDNSEIKQLEKCAVTYGCRAAQNYFLGRYEAPLPVSEACNATCIGCISLDPEGTTSAHERILEHPSADEIVEVALEHISRVDRAIVSFGQGCEGEPLLRADVMEEAIRKIREVTDKGTIHLNSNASLPKAVDRLCEAGLQSIRISMNSATEDIYRRYYRPRNYAFEDVKQSGRNMTKHGGFVSLNLLVFPGVSDREPELSNLEAFIEDVGVDMIQMRNLNMDPALYRAVITDKNHGAGMGLVAMMHRLRMRFPKLRFGYFNPPHQSWKDDPGPVTHFVRYPGEPRDENGQVIQPAKQERAKRVDPRAS